MSMSEAGANRRPQRKLKVLLGKPSQKKIGQICEKVQKGGGRLTRSQIFLTGLKNA